MTNQSQPLTLKLSNGETISVPSGKSVLRFTENGQPRSCAIVRGPKGVAVYNAEGDVQINGAPSSAHWLQPGDELRFSETMTASIEQLGVVSEALGSLLNESTQPALPTPQPELVAPTPITPTSDAHEQDSFTPATAATTFVPAPQAAAPTPTPVEALTPATAVSPEPAAEAQDTFTPATEARSFVLVEQQTTAPTAPPTAPVTPEATIPDAPSTADLVAPAATAGALAASAMSIAGVFQGEPNAPANSQPVLDEPTGFNPITSALETASAASTPEETQSDQPEISGFAAELLARIQADDNENETVGLTASETTHSPLAADGPSFSLPTPDNSPSIGSLIPELPQPSTSELVAQSEPAVDTEPNLIETTSTEAAERQTPSSSVSALLERMKSEGQWDENADKTEEEATEAEAPAPAFAEADEDVQSYMSQLLSRMRDPNAESEPAAAAATTAPKPEEKKEVQEVVERPKPVGLLKPEEFVPKNKAKRLDSLQEMRALANTQTRTAISRSQAKRMEAVKDNFNLTIAIASCIAAAVVFFFNIFGGMSFAVGMIAMISGAFFCCKTYFSELVESRKNKKKKQEAAEVAQDTQQAV